MQGKKEKRRLNIRETKRLKEQIAGEETGENTKEQLKREERRLKSRGTER